MAGRPREFDRDQALECAMLAFWQRGYEGTSMADLVQAMGIASARIYAAFGSKQALFREAIQRYESGAGCFADRALAEESLVRDALSRMLSDAATTYTEPSRPQGCMVVMAATNFAQENEEVAAWLVVGAGGAPSPANPVHHRPTATRNGRGRVAKRCGCAVLGRLLCHALARYLSAGS